MVDATSTGSARFSLNDKDIHFILLVLVHAAVGAFATALLTIVGHFNFGDYTYVVSTLASSISAALTQWAKNNN